MPQIAVFTLENLYSNTKVFLSLELNQTELNWTELNYNSLYTPVRLIKFCEDAFIYIVYGWHYHYWFVMFANTR